MDKTISLLDILPVEMIIKILKYLPKSDLGHLAQVNTGCHQLAQVPLLWLDINMDHQTLQEVELVHILARSPQNLSLNFANFYSEIMEEISQLPLSTQLTKINANSVTICPGIFALILKNCPKLEEIHLQKVHIDNSVLEAITNEFTRESLKIVNISQSYTQEVTFDIFVKFISNAKNLRSLNMSSIWISLNDQNSSIEKGYQEIFNSIPVEIEELDISGFKWILKDFHLKMIGERCKNIIKLNLSDNYAITRLGLEWIKTIDAITHLTISGCKSIKAEDTEILRKKKSIKFLEI